MDPVEFIKPDYPADAFLGTAEYYAAYRVPYPRNLLLDLLGRVNLPGGGRLLDLACGPGRVALALASSFREVWAVDLEPEMIAVAEKASEARGLWNIIWNVGRAEDFRVPPGSIDLITIGEAFHRLDQKRVCELARRWLRPGGAVATLGSFGIMYGSEPWQRATVEVVRKWTGRPLLGTKESEKPQPSGNPEHIERVLKEMGFSEVASHSFVEPLEWTYDSILGHLYSLSVCSRRVLGERREAFEADLKAALLAMDLGGVYREESKWGYTFGRNQP